MTRTKNAPTGAVASWQPATSHRITKIKATKRNKKQDVKNFLKKFQIRFDMEDDAIDLRKMAENYPGGIIPLQDIAEAVAVLLGPQYNRSRFAPYDPSDPNSLSPRFAYVGWHELFLMPIFQRDVVVNHIKKIDRYFDPSCILVPCAIKITINGRTIYAVWDGHHTLQTCYLQNYTCFGIWYIDIDAIPMSEVVKAGFPDSADGKMAYGIYKAGTNMRSINDKIKRPLHAYDDFMIGLETGDKQYAAIMNIYNKHGIVPKRHNTGKFTISQHKTAQECYALEDSRGVPGRFLDRALGLHVKHWKSPITMEIFRPMSYLYQLADVEGINLDPQFDDEIGSLLVKLYGDSNTAQESIKKSFYVNLNYGHGEEPTTHKDIVLYGLINLYNQHIGRLIMPTSKWVWKV